MLGGPTEDMTDWNFLAGQRVRIAVQGHAPIAAAMQAVFATLQAIRDGVAPKDLPNLASADLTDWVMRAALVKQRSGEFLGLKKP